MVNTGHPSRACKLCRERRVRCDEGKPFCLKCQKFKRVCPGYQDPFEAKHRDETQSTIRKAKAARAKQRSPSLDSSSSTSPTSDAHHSRDQTTLLGGGKEVGSVLSLNLQTSIDEQATCYFLSNFVLLPSQKQQAQPSGPGFLTFLLPIMKSSQVKNSPVPTAFLAAALASLAGRPNSQGLLGRAREYYSRALKDVNMALRENKPAQRDSSLAAVLLLSCYEGLSAGDDPFSGWSNHINGAKALLACRPSGAETTSTEGSRMGDLVRTSMVFQSMLGFGADPTPDDLQSWKESESGDVDKGTENSAMQPVAPNIHAIQIRAQATRLLTAGPCFPGQPQKVRELLSSAREVLGELTAWFDQAKSDEAAPRRTVTGNAVNVAEKDLQIAMAYPGQIFGYPNVWSASKHINTDALRLILADIVLRCVDWLQKHDWEDLVLVSPDTASSGFFPFSAASCEAGASSPSSSGGDDNDTSETRELGQEAVTNILASVPFFLSWTGDTTTAAPSFPCGTRDQPKSIAGLMLLWPLLTAGLSTFATTRQKRYACGRLDWIAQNMGIKPAAAVRRIIEKQISWPARVARIGDVRTLMAAAAAHQRL